MYIKNNMTDTEGFALDTARIGNTSTSKQRSYYPIMARCLLISAVPPVRPLSSRSRWG